MDRKDLEKEKAPPPPPKDEEEDGEWDDMVRTFRRLVFLFGPLI